MQRSLRASRLECGLLGLVRPRNKVAEAGPEGDVDFELLSPFGLGPDHRTPGDQASGASSSQSVSALLQSEFPNDPDEVRNCVYRGRCPFTQAWTEEAHRFEPYLTACLWLGGEVVAAAALRLNLPQPPSSASSSRSGADEAESSHVQIVLQATTPRLQRRGLGRLLTRCIMQTAAEQGHQYVTALVANRTASAAGFWAGVGFTCSPPTRSGARLPLVLHRALEDSRAHSLFSDVGVWYAEVLGGEQEGPQVEDDRPACGGVQATANTTSLVRQAAAHVTAAFAAAGPGSAAAASAAAAAAGAAPDAAAVGAEDGAAAAEQVPPARSSAVKVRIAAAARRTEGDDGEEQDAEECNRECKEEEAEEDGGQQQGEGVDTGRQQGGGALGPTEIWLSRAVTVSFGRIRLRRLVVEALLGPDAAQGRGAEAAAVPIPLYDAATRQRISSSRARLQPRDRVWEVLGLGSWLRARDAAEGDRLVLTNGDDGGGSAAASAVGGDGGSRSGSAEDTGTRTAPGPRFFVAYVRAAGRAPAGCNAGAPLPEHPPGSVSFCLVSCNKAGGCEMSRAVARAAFPTGEEIVTRAWSNRLASTPGSRARGGQEEAAAAAAAAAATAECSSSSRDVKLYYRAAGSGCEIRPYAGARLTCYSLQCYYLRRLRPLRQALGVSTEAPLRLTVLAPCGRVVLEAAPTPAPAVGADAAAASPAVLLPLTDGAIKCQGCIITVRSHMVERLLGPEMARGAGITTVPLHDAETREPIPADARLQLRRRSCNSPSLRWCVYGLGKWLRAHDAKEGDSLAFTAELGGQDEGGGEGGSTRRVYVAYVRQSGAGDQEQQQQQQQEQQQEEDEQEQQQQPLNVTSTTRRGRGAIKAKRSGTPMAGTPMAAAARDIAALPHAKRRARGTESGATPDCGSADVPARPRASTPTPAALPPSGPQLQQGQRQEQRQGQGNGQGMGQGMGQGKGQPQPLSRTRGSAGPQQRNRNDRLAPQRTTRATTQRQLAEGLDLLDHGLEPLACRPPAVPAAAEKAQLASMVAAAVAAVVAVGGPEATAGGAEPIATAAVGQEAAEHGGAPGLAAETSTGPTVHMPSAVATQPPTRQPQQQQGSSNRGGGWKAVPAAALPEVAGAAAAPAAVAVATAGCCSDGAAGSSGAGSKRAAGELRSAGDLLVGDPPLSLSGSRRQLPHPQQKRARVDARSPLQSQPQHHHNQQQQPQAQQVAASRGSPAAEPPQVVGTPGEPIVDLSPITPGLAGRGGGAGSSSPAASGAQVSAAGLHDTSAAGAAALPLTSAPAASAPAPPVLLPQALARHYPRVSKLIMVIAEQEQQQEGQKQPEQELRGRRREVLPLQVLKHYAAGMGWQYEVEFERQSMQPGTVGRLPAAAAAGTSAAGCEGSEGGGTAAGATAYVATFQLRSKEEDMAISAIGKVAADKDTARQLGAAACLQQLLAAGVSPQLMWPQLQPQPAQQQPQQPTKEQQPPPQPQCVRPPAVPPVQKQSVHWAQRPCVPPSPLQSQCSGRDGGGWSAGHGHHGGRGGGGYGGGGGRYAGGIGAQHFGASMDRNQWQQQQPRQPLQPQPAAPCLGWAYPAETCGYPLMPHAAMSQQQMQMQMESQVFQAAFTGGGMGTALQAPGMSAPMMQPTFLAAAGMGPPKVGSGQPWLGQGQAWQGQQWQGHPGWPS